MTYDKERCQRAKEKLQRMENARIEFSEAAWMFAHEDHEECCSGGPDAQT